jgi:hypothetical protein
MTYRGKTLVYIWLDFSFWKNSKKRREKSGGNLEEGQKSEKSAKKCPKKDKKALHNPRFFGYRKFLICFTSQLASRT